MSELKKNEENKQKKTRKRKKNIRGIRREEKGTWVFYKKNQETRTLYKREVEKFKPLLYWLS